MKYARIRISKDCEISVSVPRSYTAAQAKDFILKHESWIRQTLARLRSKLLASDQVRILGKIYKLKFSRKVGLGPNCGASEVSNDSVRSCVDGGASSGAGNGILKFHSGGCAPQSDDAGKFNSAASDQILKFDPAARDGILKFKPAESGEISNFNSVASEEIPLMSEKISKSASENAPQNAAQSAQAAAIEHDEPDFTIKNFIQSSKFKDKIFISGGAIFCEGEGEFAAFKKAFALELYLRYIAKFSPRIGRKIVRVRVRKMQTRWGSCNHAKGYLNFSLSLIERDPRFVEYVVLHELAHFIHANHGANFYALIAQIMPDFRARIKLGRDE
ncbi:M48 family metallopeptidase [uncultured Campylobacter sp.]|uniref:M48 family metallopeptidase n=1 Tax=uncultured Campylobacter sp. TaxID=218934 RepID=UPI00261B848C|nr:M48 family metallopeptidase [uncultured Campylobacter sp.]